VQSHVDSDMHVLWCIIIVSCDSMYVMALARALAVCSVASANVTRGGWVPPLPVSAGPLLCDMWWVAAMLRLSAWCYFDACSIMSCIVDDPSSPIVAA